MAQRLRPAVNREVLGRGDHFQVLGIVALQSLDELNRHAPGEVRVLAVSFHAASPTGVADQVDVGRPKREALVDVPLPAPHELIVLGAGFVGNGGGRAEDQAGVPGGGQADRLREDGGASGARHAMQTLVPPVIGGHVQPLDGGRRVHHLGDLLFQGHTGEQVLDALLERGVGILIKRHALAPQGRRQDQSGPKKSHASLSPRLTIPYYPFMA